MKKKILFYMATIIIAISCGSKVSHEELLHYIKSESNGLVKEKSINGINFRLINMPKDLMVYRDIMAIGNIDNLKIDELKGNYDYLYFTLSVSANGKEVLNLLVNDNRKFGQIVNELAFGLNDKIILTNSNTDTLQLLDSHFQRTYGMARSSNILLVFDKKYLIPGENLKFQLKEFGLGTAQVIFRFDTDDLLKVPSIDFKDINLFQSTKN
jgi:hypothetical protein